MKYISVLLALLVSATCLADIFIDPTATIGDVETYTVVLEENEYDHFEVRDYRHALASECPGNPSLPYNLTTYVLPPGQQISALRCTDATWETFQGTFIVEPAQAYTSTESEFTKPNPEIYSGSAHYPSSPVEIVNQGSCMGYGLVTVKTYPLRYIPSEGRLIVLTSAHIEVVYEASGFEVLAPLRVSELGYSLREQTISNLVNNPGDMNLYGYDLLDSEPLRTHALDFSTRPSLAGDAVDMVIITTEDLADDFQALADIRTCQGILTVVRTIEWIEGEGGYTGCDTPERIRNFLRDCYINWGTFSVLLGGDSHIVPVRLVKGIYFDTPEDKYYADMSDDDWSYYLGYWRRPNNTYFDLFVGRWPVDNGDDVLTLMTKMHVFENDPPNSFARRMLMAACDNNYNPCPAFYDLYLDLDEAGQIGPVGGLDVVYKLFEPISKFDPQGEIIWAGDDWLTRESYLNEMSSGYQIMLHGDHSGVHNMGAGTNGEWNGSDCLFEYDLIPLGNHGAPSILWHCACFSGHFEDAECIVEIAMLSCDDNAFVAVVASPKPQAVRPDFDYFIDALYPCGYSASDPVHYIGQAFNISQNQAYNSYVVDLFGDPFMFVWRDDPEQLSAISPVQTVYTGTFDLSFSVHCNGLPVNDAKVCLYMEDEIYAIGYTNNLGIASFTDLTASAPGEIIVTASKREGPSGIANYTCDNAYIIVEQGNGPFVVLENMLVDDGSEGEINPGETVYLDIAAFNSGTMPAFNVTATLECSHPDITILDGSEALGTISAGEYERADDAFQIHLDTDPSSSVPIQMIVTFEASLGQIWKSQWEIAIFQGDIDIPVYETAARHNPFYTELTIDISRIVLANTDRGNISNLTITAQDFRPQTSGTIAGDLTESVALLEGGSGCELDQPILVRIVNIPPGDPWADPDLVNCRFNLAVSDEVGNTYESSVVDLGHLLGTSGPDIPDSPHLFEATDTTLIMAWDGQSGIEGFYVYYKESNFMGAFNRLGWVPFPIETATIAGLNPSTSYDIEVSCVDTYGRESDRASTSEYTCLETLAMLQVNGNPCAGPVVINDRLYVVTSNGYVYNWSMNPIGGAGYTYYSNHSFTGCAAGDVDRDGDIDLVACGYRIEEQGVVVVSVFENDGIGNMSLACEIETESGQHLLQSCCVPVLIQADTGYLEITLVTCSKWFSQPGTTWFHVWRFDQEAGQWEDFFTDGPMEFQNYNHLSYTPPVLLGDYDSDGNVEMAVATNNSSGLPFIYVVDLIPAATTQQVNLGLDSDWNLRTSLASVEHAGNTYVCGVVAKHGTDYGSPQEWKRLFIVKLNGFIPDVWLSDEYEITRFFWTDQYGGGPAIALIDDDLSPDLVVCLDDEVKAWSLNGTELNLCGSMELNPIFMGNDQNVSSPVVNGAYNGETGVYIGYSTRHYGFNAPGREDVVAGLPVHSEDQVVGAPIVMDLTGNSDLDLLVFDNSGFIRILDLGTTPGTVYWPMFLHDSRRTGHYGYEISVPGDFDLSIIDVKELESIDIDSESNRFYQVTVGITGVETVTALETPLGTSTSEAIRESNSAVSIRSMSTASSIREAIKGVDVAAYIDGQQVSCQSVPLFEGMHDIRFSLPNSRCGSVNFVVDPNNEYCETDEGNNCSESGVLTSPGLLTVYNENPAYGRVLLSITNATSSSQLVIGSLYSLDGRLVAEGSIEMPVGMHRSVDLFDGHDELPAGLYALRLQYGGLEKTRRVILLP